MKSEFVMDVTGISGANGIPVDYGGVSEGFKDSGKPVEIGVPREIQVATQAGIDAYLACERASISPDVAVQFAGVAFRAVIEMAENERDRSANLLKYTLPFQGGAKKGT